MEPAIPGAQDVAAWWWLLAAAAVILAAGLGLSRVSPVQYVGWGAAVAGAFASAFAATMLVYSAIAT